MISDKIIVDTREQLPLFTHNIISRKLDEGDYNTEFLLDKIVIERKSPADLYGSIVQGHVRFLDEIMRSRFMDKKIYIVVECTKEQFLNKEWEGAYYCKLSSKVLASIISTIEDKYCVIFLWCDGRVKVKQCVKDIILINNKLYNNNDNI